MEWKVPISYLRLLGAIFGPEGSACCTNFMIFYTWLSMLGAWAVDSRPGSCLILGNFLDIRGGTSEVTLEGAVCDCFSLMVETLRM